MFCEVAIGSRKRQLKVRKNTSQHVLPDLHLRLQMKPKNTQVHLNIPKMESTTDPTASNQTCLFLTIFVPPHINDTGFR